MHYRVCDGGVIEREGGLARKGSVQSQLATSPLFLLYPHGSIVCSPIASPED